MDVSAISSSLSYPKYTSSFLNQLQSEWNEFVLEISHSTPHNALPYCNLDSSAKYNALAAFVESLNKLNQTSSCNILIPVPLNALKKLFSSLNGNADDIFKYDFFQEIKENLNLTKLSCRKLKKLLSIDDPSEISDFPSPCLPKNFRKSAPPNLFPRRKFQPRLIKKNLPLSEIDNCLVFDEHKNPARKNDSFNFNILFNEKNSALTKVGDCAAFNKCTPVDKKLDLESNTSEKDAQNILSKLKDNRIAGVLTNNDLMKQHSGSRNNLEINHSDSSSLFYTLRQQKKSSKPTLVCTYFNQKELSKIYQTVKKLGFFEIENHVSSRTTHLVCGGSNKTINLCKAIARGCWVLDIEWVISSNNVNRWLLEERFEKKNLSSAVLENRLKRQKCGSTYRCEVFANCGSMYVSDKCSQPSSQDLKELILLGSGRLEERPEGASFVIGFTPKYRYVKEIWILNCVLRGYVMDVNKYVRPKK